MNCETCTILEHCTHHCYTYLNGLIVDFIDSENIITSLLAFFKGEIIEILFSLLVIFFIGHLIARSADKFIREDRRRYKLKKNSKYITWIIAFVWTALLYNNYTSSSESFPIFIVGLLLAGIAFSMRDIFSNIVGWLMVASNNGFQSGDRIEVDDVRGDVIDVGVLRTTLTEIGDWDERGEQSTGKLISFPNSKILTHSVTNFNRGFETMWNEISVMVTFESDWAKAEKHIEAIAFREYEENKDRYLVMMQKLKREFMVTYNYLSPKVYVRIEESGVRLTLRHMVEVRRRRMSNDRMNREILEKFDSEPTIQFAYPTTRFYSTTKDGQ